MVFALFSFTHIRSQNLTGLLQFSMKSIFAPFLMILNLSGYCQDPEYTVIEDPGLTFAYLLPENWTNDDDPYFHYVKPPCAKKGLEITYYDGRCKVIEDCFEAETRGAFPEKYTDFKIIEKGVLTVEKAKTPWLSFSYIEEGEKKLGFYATFVRLDQQFTFLFTEGKKCFKQEENVIRELIEGIRIQPN